MLNDRQLALLVGLCVAASTEALRNATAPAGFPTPERESVQMSSHTASQQAQTRSGSATELRLEGLSRHDGAQGTLLMTIAEAARTLSIGRTLMYELVRRGQIASVSIGRVRRIPRTALEAFVRHEMSASSEGQERFDETQHSRKERDHEHQTRES